MFFVNNKDLECNAICKHCHPSRYHRKSQSNYEKVKFKLLLPFLLLIRLYRLIVDTKTIRAKIIIFGNYNLQNQVYICFQRPFSPSENPYKM